MRNAAARSLTTSPNTTLWTYALARGCNLDYALAEMWGGTLQRSGTLVGGESCCNFRIRAPADVERSRDGEAKRRLPMLAT